MPIERLSPVMVQSNLPMWFMKDSCVRHVLCLDFWVLLAMVYLPH